MLLKLTNETKTDQDQWTIEDQREFQKYMQQKKRGKSNQPGKPTKHIVDLYGTQDTQKKKTTEAQSMTRKGKEMSNLIKNMKGELDQKIFETQVKENKLAKLEKELEKLKHQRRNVCTPQTFNQSSLINHTSAIFDNEKLEAKVQLMLELIQEAIEKNKWEKFFSDSCSHLLTRLRLQKKYNEVKICALMPEFKSMNKLGENTERLKFLTYSANLISQSGISQCYTKIQERVEHRKEKVEEKTIIFKEEETIVQQLKMERTLVKKLIYEQKKKIKKLQNINERLKLTEEEKIEIERRIKKEIQVLRCFDSALILREYLTSKQELALKEKTTEKIEEEFNHLIVNFANKMKKDHLGTKSVTDSQVDISLVSTGQQLKRLQTQESEHHALVSAHMAAANASMRSPDFKRRQSISHHQTRPHSPLSLNQKMKDFFKLKIEHEMRIQKWEVIRGNEPDLDYIVEQYMHCMFKNNSVQQTFDEMQQECKDKKVLIDQMKAFLTEKREDLNILTHGKTSLLREQISRFDSSAFIQPEEQMTVNQLSEQIENSNKLLIIIAERDKKNHLKVKIDAVQMEILIRVCYRLSQLKDFAKDMVKYDKGMRDIINEYDLISKAFGLNIPLNDDDTQSEEQQEKQVQHALSTPLQKKMSHEDLMLSDISLKNAELQKKKKSLKKQQEKNQQLVQKKKSCQVKPKLPENFNVMSFLKKVLTTKVVDIDDKSKNLFNKIKILIYGLKDFLRDEQEVTLFSDDIDANNYMKYKRMVQEALERKKAMQIRNFSDNISLLSEEDIPNKSPAKDKGNSILQTVHFSQGNNQEETLQLEEESATEIDYVNKSRSQFKQQRYNQRSHQDILRPQSAPKYQRGKGQVASHIETHQYQQEVKKYRNVMSNLERTEQIFIQKFKKGQTDVYHSIQNPNSLRTHKVALHKLFDKGLQSQSQPKISSNQSAFLKSQQIKVNDKQANNNINMTQFGKDKINNLEKSVLKHQKILVNLYGSQGLSQRPQTAKLMKQSVSTKSLIKDTLILPIASGRSTSRNRDSTSLFKVEFGKDKNSGFGDIIQGVMTARQQPNKQFLFPMEMFKTLNPPRPTEKSIFQKYNSQQKMIPLRPMTAFVKRQ